VAATVTGVGVRCLTAADLAVGDRLVRDGSIVTFLAQTACFVTVRTTAGSWRWRKDRGVTCYMDRGKEAA